MFKLAVFIGRFAVPHLGHLDIASQTLQQSDQLLILIGSSGEARTPRCPWTFEERKQLWLDIIPTELHHRILIEPLYDHLYNDQHWISQVQQLVANCNVVDKSIAIVGCDKDETSWYLHAFPQWKHLQMDLTQGDMGTINATDVRNAYFLEDEILSDMVPLAVDVFLQQFMLTEEFLALQQEFDYIEKYKHSWSSSPYTPIFTTVDSVVIQSGHVLLIQRGNFPQRGAYAIPGGFLNPNETLLDGALRELVEETKIKVPTKVLQGSVIACKVYDYPKRSMRGRIVTHAYHIKLKDDLELPRVKGSDDAKHALWVPIADILTMRDKFFEDHYHILRNILGF